MFRLFSWLFLLLLGGILSPGQGGELPGEQHVVVTVHMEGEGLESRIHYAQGLDEAWSQDEVTAVLKDIGYPEDGAAFLQWDTVAVMPLKPQP